MRLRLIVLMAVLGLVVASTGWAQQTGEIFGKVTDASGAVMPGVTVTEWPEAAAADDGRQQRDRHLPVPAACRSALYDVKFELAGFKTLIREGDPRLRSASTCRSTRRWRSPPCRKP